MWNDSRLFASFEGDIQGAFIFIHFLAHSFASVTCHFLEKAHGSEYQSKSLLLAWTDDCCSGRLWLPHVALFPDQAPMDFDPKALLPQVITKLVAFIA